MRALLVAGLFLVAALPLADAGACGSTDRCLDVVFVITNDPGTLGAQLVGFYATGGAPGPGVIAAKGVQGATRPVVCSFSSSVCQTPRAPQISVSPGDCLDVLATLAIGEVASVHVVVAEVPRISFALSQVQQRTYCR